LGRETKYHLVLPHLAHQKRYRHFYHSRRNDDYVILDNGAAEGVEFSPKQLHVIADELGAHEIVVPDTLAEAEDTMAKALAFSRYAQDGYRYMAVLQGRDTQEILKCLRFYTESPQLQYITSIGIPRLLNNFHRQTRVMMAEFIQERHMDFAVEFHALGASPWIKEVLLLSEFPCMRGIDTSLPVYMGLAGVSLKEDYMIRPEGFFDIHDGDLAQVKENIRVYLEWANYDVRAELPDKG
jgi:hypothetical protein